MEKIVEMLQLQLQQQREEMQAREQRFRVQAAAQEQRFCEQAERQHADMKAMLQLLAERRSQSCEGDCLLPKVRSGVGDYAEAVSTTASVSAPS